MRYLGGKFKLGEILAEILVAQKPKTYLEPFCGMFSVGKNLTCTRFAGDNSPDLVEMLCAARDGWVPPTEISEEEYAYWRGQPPSAMRGFVGFGCSFGGKFFGGYAREKGRNFAKNAANSLLRLATRIQGVTFKCQDYTDWPDIADLTYCDPPYAGTTEYSTGEFDHAKFWDWVRSRKGKVFVSEYSAPDDFVAVWEKGVKSTVNGWTGPQQDRIERLFIERSRLTPTIEE